jgi:hypothetical protein
MLAITIGSAAEAVLMILGANMVAAALVTNDLRLMDMARLPVFLNRARRVPFGCMQSVETIHE